MQTENDITTLNIDEVSYEVDKLSEEVRGLVAVYNRWNRKESDARGELAILQAAKQTLSAQIVATVRSDAETAAANEAAAEVAATAEVNITTDEAVAATTEVAAAEAVEAAK